LLSAGLAPGVKYVPAKVEVTQVRFGGAQGLEVFKHVAQLRTNNLNIVTLLKPASVIKGGLAPQDVKGRKVQEGACIGLNPKPLCACLLLQYLIQSCAWRTCAMRYDEPRLVWTRLTTTH
jgi:hypothetical protein